MFQLIQGHYDEAMQLCIACAFGEARTQWELLMSLLFDCSHIAKVFVNDSQLVAPESLTSISNHRAQWGVSEYDTLWSTFEGVAYWLIGDFKHSESAFQRAVDISQSQGERVFLPLTYLWWARTAVRGGDCTTAKERFIRGAEIAKGMGAVFVEHMICEECEDACPSV